MHINTHEGTQSALDSLKGAFVHAVVEIGVDLTEEFLNRLIDLANDEDSVMSEVVNQLRKEKSDILSGTVDSSQ
jgi:hypothetical protein